MNQQGVKVIILVFDNLILNIMVASLSSGVKGISVCMSVNHIDIKVGKDGTYFN